jgi:hypothetical protein
MCDVVHGGKSVFGRYGVRWRKILKFILQRQFLRRDMCPNQILMESSAFVKGMMNLEVLQSAVERFSVCGGAQIYCWGGNHF